jgi:RNA polymerase sigma-70 factor (ECF subfamily)
MDTGVPPDLPELIRLARAGQTPALGRLFELHRHYLTFLARLQIGRRLQGKVGAADLVQETFLKAYTSFPKFRGTTEEELAAWLRQILSATLANVVRHYFHSQRRNLRLESEVASDLEGSVHLLRHSLVAKQRSPSDSAARREQAVLLADALEQLPKKYREVIILRQFESLSFPQIAKRTDRTLHSVQKLWVRGLHKLRRSLEDAS